MRSRNAIRTTRLPALTIVAALAATGAAPAADDGASAVDERFEQMQRELERMRQDNQAMRAELDELRTQSDDNWLTERRAEEVRALVADVLADADTRASLLQDGLTAGWSDGFFIADPQGRFRLAIDGQLQFRWMYSYHDNQPPGVATDIDRHRSGFENARTRLTFRGHVFSPDLQYLVRGGFQRMRTDTRTDSPDPQGGTFHLLDAWIRYHLDDTWSLRLGQFKLPFSRETLVSSAHQLAVERSAVDDSLGMGRSQGVELTFAEGPHRLAVAYSDGGTDNIAGPLLILGGFPDGSPMNTAAMEPTVEYAFTARYEHLLAGDWFQFRDFTSPLDDEHGFGLLLGIGGHAQRSEAGTPSTYRAHWYAYTIDVSAEWGGANAFGSFTHHHGNLDGIGSINIFGVVAQGGFYVAPRWEVFARYEYGSMHFDEPPGFADFTDPMHLGTVGFNYYMDGHDAKWTTDFGVGFTRLGRTWAREPGGLTGWRLENEGADPQILFRTQLQLLF